VFYLILVYIVKAFVSTKLSSRSLLFYLVFVTICLNGFSNYNKHIRYSHVAIVQLKSLRKIPNILFPDYNGSSTTFLEGYLLSEVKPEYVFVNISLPVLIYRNFQDWATSRY